MITGAKIWVTLALMSVCVTALAAPSIERGKVLFSGPELGSSGRSCADCHPGGKGLDETARYSDVELAAIVDRCIGKALEGKPLGTDVDDMKSLIMYLRALAGPAK